MARTHGGDRSEGGQWHVHACTSNGSPQCAKKPMGHTGCRDQTREHACKRESRGRSAGAQTTTATYGTAERALLPPLARRTAGRGRAGRPAGEIGASG